LLEADPIIDATFKAISVGTFLYISLVEIIPNEYHKPGNKFIKFLGLNLGFLLIFLINAFAGEHSHESDHGHAHWIC